MLFQALPDPLPAGAGSKHLDHDHSGPTEWQLWGPKPPVHKKKSPLGFETKVSRRPVIRRSLERDSTGATLAFTGTNITLLEVAPEGSWGAERASWGEGDCDDADRGAGEGLEGPTICTSSASSTPDAFHWNRDVS